MLCVSSSESVHPPVWQSPHGRPLPVPGGRTLVMGILNVTPDSFSDGGQLLSAQAVVDRAGTMLAEGADVLDVGGESTRPGGAPVSAVEECERVLPALAALRRAFPDAPISIDTYKAEVAAAAVQAGADIVNDIWGCLHGWTAEDRGRIARLLAEQAGKPALPPKIPGSIRRSEEAAEERRHVSRSLAEQAGKPALLSASHHNVRQSGEAAEERWHVARLLAEQAGKPALLPTSPEKDRDPDDAPEDHSDFAAVFQRARLVANWPRSPMAESVAALRCPVILMHNRPDRDYGDFWTDLMLDLGLSLAVAGGAGVADHQIWLDPGFGFAKDPPHNLEVLKHLDRIVELGCPVLLGTSRKSTIGLVLGSPVNERLDGTGATIVWGIQQGCRMVRVHDVAAMLRFVRIADAMKAGIAWKA